MREWRHVIRIALGWLLNLSAFVVMLAVFVVYGCTFRSLAADDNSEVEGCPSNSLHPLSHGAARQHAPRCGNTQAFMNSWLISIAQRFLAMEPIIILVSKGIP